MKVLVTGANGYIGQRLILSLLAQGHQVVCLVRDPERFDKSRFLKFDGSFYVPDGVKIQEGQVSEDSISVVQGDLLADPTLIELPADIDVAFYLVHSMSSKNRKDFKEMESECAKNFVQVCSGTSIKQVIYLSGISNDDELSKHLSSRKNVEEILRQGKFHLTVLRAAIIIGSGSASFEIIRDLVEKLPIMIAPKWLETKCQPIAIRNVIQYLTGVMLERSAFDKVFDIGGPNVLNYREMLLGYARVRKLKRWIITVPFMTPRLSSYWLHFVTSTNYTLARTLVSSLKNEVICKNLGIENIVNIKCLGYEEALLKTIYRIDKNEIPSSWKDALNLKTSAKFVDTSLLDVPQFGCLTDIREKTFVRNLDEVRDNIWCIGGQRGWYYLDWAWKLRGYMDKLVGGVGLRRGRRDANTLKPGDAVDFWRVLYANYQGGYLVLYAEMKLPGEAWLEFKLSHKSGVNYLTQKATFRPRGLLGRIYWYALVPIHGILFEGMARRIINYNDPTCKIELPQA